MGQQRRRRQERRERYALNLPPADAVPSMVAALPAQPCQYPACPNGRPMTAHRIPVGGGIWLAVCPGLCTEQMAPRYIDKQMRRQLEAEQAAWDRAEQDQAQRDADAAMYEAVAAQRKAAVRPHVPRWETDLRRAQRNPISQTTSRFRAVRCWVCGYERGDHPTWPDEAIPDEVVSMVETGEEPSYGPG